MRILSFFVAVCFCFSSSAFFSSGSQGNCALPLYLAALQGGHGGKGYGAKKAKLKQHRRYWIRRLERKIEAFNELKKNMRKAKGHLEERLDDDDVVQQMIEYMKNDGNPDDEYKKHCDPDYDDEDYSFIHNNFKSYIAGRFEALRPPAELISYLEDFYLLFSDSSLDGFFSKGLSHLPFNLAFLQTLTQKSFEVVVPEATAEDDVSVKCDAEQCTGKCCPVAEGGTDCFSGSALANGECPAVESTVVAGSGSGSGSGSGGTPPSSGSDIPVDKPDDLLLGEAVTAITIISAPESNANANVEVEADADAGSNASPEAEAEAERDPSSAEEYLECETWRKWGHCATDDGAIEPKICKDQARVNTCAFEKDKGKRWDPLKSNFLSITVDGDASKRNCREALAKLQDILKEMQSAKDEIDEIKNELAGIEQSLEDIQDAELLGTEADDCDDCEIDRLRKIKEIVDPAPSGWEVLGNVVGTVGAAALGYYGVKSANRLRDQQGFAAQPGLALNLAYPFIMKGLYGGGLFGGGSSSLACSPTMFGGGPLFGGNPFGNQQMMYAQQAAYMQQMQMYSMMNSGMGGFVTGGMMPGMMGGMGGMMGAIQPGFVVGGMIAGGMMPGMMGGMGGMIAGNMMGGMGGMMGAIQPGFVVGGMIAGGMMGGMGGMMPGMMGGMGGMMPGMGGMMPGMMGGMGGMMPGGMMGGGMQSYFQHQQALMSWRMSQMNNYMQRQQAASGLYQEMWRLQMQIQQIMYGGSGGGGQTTVGGGGNEAGGGGDDDDDYDNSQIIRGV